MTGQSGQTLVDVFGEPRELGEAEAVRLKELEAVIAENFQGFYAVGCALAEINASRLYRATHDTFEEYCRERFEIARRTAYQYIEAKKVMDNVRQGAQIEILNPAHMRCNYFPLNERQVRPLTRLEPDAQVQAWERAVETAPRSERGPIITAKLVSNVVSSLIGQETQKKADKIKKEIEPVVSKEFSDVVWTLIEVVRAELRKPLKVKTKKVMIESLQRVSNLLKD